MGKLNDNNSNYNPTNDGDAISFVPMIVIMMTHHSFKSSQFHKSECILHFVTYLIPAPIKYP